MAVVWQNFTIHYIFFPWNTDWMRWHQTDNVGPSTRSLGIWYGPPSRRLWSSLTPSMSALNRPRKGKSWNENLPSFLQERDKCRARLQQTHCQTHKARACSMAQLHSCTRNPYSLSLFVTLDHSDFWRPKIAWMIFTNSRNLLTVKEPASVIPSFLLLAQ